MCLSCSLGQWCINFAAFASQSLTSPSLLPVKNRLVLGIVDIFVTLPEICINSQIKFRDLFFGFRRNMKVKNRVLGFEPKWAFGIYQSIPFLFWSPSVEHLPSKFLCFFIFPVAIYRKSCKATSPFLPPVTIIGEIEPLPMSLSNTEIDRAPPSWKKKNKKNKQTLLKSYDYGKWQ